MLKTKNIAIAFNRAKKIASAFQKTAYNREDLHKDPDYTTYFVHVVKLIKVKLVNMRIRGIQESFQK